MRALILAVAAFASCAPVPAIEVDLENRTLKLSEAEMIECARGGGCALVPEKAFQQAMQQAFEMGKKAAEKSCRKDSSV